MTEYKDAKQQIKSKKPKQQQQNASQISKLVLDSVVSTLFHMLFPKVRELSAKVTQLQALPLALSSFGISVKFMVLKGMADFFLTLM